MSGERGRRAARQSPEGVHLGRIGGSNALLASLRNLWYKCYDLVTLWKATQQEQQLYEENS